MNSKPVIQVKDLVARYNHKTVLNHIGFDVYPGEIFMIAGASGCGKTTLLNHMIGLLEPVSGEILIEGKNLVSADESEKLALLKKIGVLYQQGALFGSLNLLENVCLPLEELTDLPSEAIEVIARNKLKMVGLADVGEYMPAELSGGMQKRAAIARAMALDPQILFLDEPSAGLDPIIMNELDDLIVNLSKTLGITCVIISHELISIYKIAQRVILLQNAQIIAEGKPKQLSEQENPSVRAFFRRI